jgi:Pentapeptide repeats (8 copies)
VASEEHFALLKQGVGAWNYWRTLNPDIVPDLTEADLTKADLRQVNLTWAKLTRADLTDANLTDANLAGANLTTADLRGADLTERRLALAMWSPRYGDCGDYRQHRGDLRICDAWAVVGRSGGKTGPAELS